MVTSGEVWDICNSITQVSAASKQFDFLYDKKILSVNKRKEKVTFHLYLLRQSWDLKME